MIFGLVLMLYWDHHLKKEIRKWSGVTELLGVGTGFYAMLGNFAGAFANIYYLLTRLSKKELIATATCIFFW